MNKPVYFKVDDLVTCASGGKGVVVKIDKNDDYPVVVEFENDYSCSYTFDGRVNFGRNIVLHQGHIEIQEPVLKPKLEVGDLVWKMPGSRQELGRLIKVKEIHPTYIVCCNDYTWTNWIPLEEGPLFADLKKQMQ